MSLKIKILGSNSAAPAFNRNQTSQLLICNDLYYLIDCGEGTQLQINKARIKLNKIDHIFISHLHGDHYFGLIGLMSTMHLFGRSKLLTIYGPSPLREIIDLQLRISETTLNYPVNYIYTDLTGSDIIYTSPAMEVRKFPLDHKIFCTGFIFKTREGKRKILREKIPAELSIADFARLKDGLDILDENGEVLFRNQDLTRPGTPSVSYAYCSDTRYNPAIAEQIKEVDLLYHEATFANDMKDRARDTYHSTAEEAALIAKMGQVKKLLLGHFSVRYRELDPVLEEAKKHFDESYLAIEGEVFEVK